MKKKFYSKVLLGLVFGIGLATACSSDDSSSAAPTISLSQTSIDVKAEETISVTVTYTAEASVSSVTATKFWDGTAEGSPSTLASSSTQGSITFEYQVSQDDADHIVKFNFTILDDDGRTSQVELVINVELTKRQLLLKYNWALNEEVRGLTGENDIDDAYTDDIYRFNEDGTFDKSIGAKVDDFSDIWYNYCKWDLNEETGRLLMHRTGAFLANVVDTLDITTIDMDKLEANVTYLGLDVFNTGTEIVPYEAVEQYVKKFAAQAKGASFDPYQAGADDDGGPAGTCNDIELVNP